MGTEFILPPPKKRAKIRARAYLDFLYSDLSQGSRSKEREAAHSPGLAAMEMNGKVECWKRSSKNWSVHGNTVSD